MDLLELTKSQDTTRKIVDILQEAQYQDITVKTHKGVITKVENTIKMYLPKDE